MLETSVARGLRDKDFMGVPKKKKEGVCGDIAIGCSDALQKTEKTMYYILYLVSSISHSTHQRLNPLKGTFARTLVARLKSSLLMNYKTTEAYAWAVRNPHKVFAT